MKIVRTGVLFAATVALGAPALAYDGLGSVNTSTDAGKAAAVTAAERRYPGHSIADIRKARTFANCDPHGCQILQTWQFSYKP